MLRRVVWQKFTDVSEVLTASMGDDHPGDGGSKHLKRLSISTILHDAISQKTAILHTRRSENPKSLSIYLFILNCGEFSKAAQL
jgi:hypothetical protein